MRDDIVHPILISVDAEIETPIPVNSGLPNVIGLIIFFCSQGWMVEILEQQSGLFCEGFLDGGGSATEGSLKSFRIEQLHFFQRFFVLPFRATIISSTVLKGPRTRPAFKSSRL